MAKPPVDVSREQAVLNANILVAQSVWRQRFSQYGGRYNEAYAAVEKRIKNANKNQDKMLIATLGKIADLAVKPFGLYGQIASVAIAAITEVAKGAVTSGSVINLPSPAPLTYAKDIEGTAEKMFEPVLRASAELARRALTQKTMPHSEYARLKSDILMSPIWYPPKEVQNGLVQRRMEMALYAAYFDSLASSTYASHELRFLKEIVKFLMDEAYVSPSESHGWEKYPEPISQGGPGDFKYFLQKTQRIWSYKIYDYSEKGWLLPLPDVPEKAKIKRAVNVSIPPPPTPTPSGKVTIISVKRIPTPTPTKDKPPEKPKAPESTIIIESVEQLPILDWSDVPVLQGKQ
jgi:hypothetical protein